MQIAQELAARELAVANARTVEFEFKSKLREAEEVITIILHAPKPRFHRSGVGHGSYLRHACLHVHRRRYSVSSKPSPLRWMGSRRSRKISSDASLTHRRNWLLRRLRGNCRYDHLC